MGRCMQHWHIAVLPGHPCAKYCQQSWEKDIERLSSEISKLSGRERCQCNSAGHAQDMPRTCQHEPNGIHRDPVPRGHGRITLGQGETHSSTVPRSWPWASTQVMGAKCLKRPWRRCATTRFRPWCGMMCLTSTQRHAKAPLCSDTCAIKLTKRQARPYGPMKSRMVPEVAFNEPSILVHILTSFYIGAAPSEHHTYHTSANLSFSVRRS